MPTIVRMASAAQQAKPILPSSKGTSSFFLSMFGGGGGGRNAFVHSSAWGMRPNQPLHHQQQQQQRRIRRTFQWSSALCLLTLALAWVRYSRSTHLGDSAPSSSSLSLLLFNPSSDGHLEQQQQQQQQQQQSVSSPASDEPAQPTLWSYEEIDVVLGCNSRQIVEASVQHLVKRMDRARRLATLNRTVYGTLQDPLFGFFIPKTGSNTQEYYQLEALAAIQQVSYTGCPDNMYGCMQEEPHLSSRTCAATAFGNHFSPKVLIPELLKANCTSTARGWNVDPSSNTAIGDVLANYGVCTAAFRNPLERIVSAFYEWSYRKTTNLTAIEYWHTHGSSKFPKPQPQGSFIGMYQFKTDPAAIQPTKDQPVDMAVLEAVMQACVIGITENLTDYVTTLSRIVWINPPAKQQSALKVRSRTRHGMVAVKTDENNNTNDADELAHWTQQFYMEMEAYVRHDMAVWNLARHVASAQGREATRPPHDTPIIPSHLVPKVLRKGVEGNCNDCTRCTPPGYKQYRWTSYAARNVADLSEPTNRAKMAATGSGGPLARWLSWFFGDRLSTPKEEEPIVCVGPNIRQQLRDGEGRGQVSHLCCAHERFT